MSIERLTRHRRSALLLGSVGVVAFVVRLLPVITGGGFASSRRYDDSVYYAAADALTFGRVPYRDFVLLHPPGIALLLAPFALLGRLTADHLGMMTAQLSFMLVGGCNAIAVAVIARRWGRSVAIGAGLLYACWQPAVYAEQSTMLEPLGTSALLAALLIILGRPSGSRWRHVMAGGLLGLSLTLKIWYVAPLAAVAVWTLLAHRRADALRLVAAALAVAAAVMLPFFAMAPRRMYDMVVRDQFTRASGGDSRLRRLSSILGAETFGSAHSSSLHVFTAVIGVLLVGAAIRCLTLGREPVLLVLLLVVTVGVLMASPAYFGHYAELTAAPIVLVLAAGLNPGSTFRPPSPAAGRVAIAAGLAAIAFAAVHVSGIPTGRHIQWVKLDAAAPAGCVASDSPEALIGMDRLSSDLAGGCQVPVDVSGLGYDLLTRRGSHLVYVTRLVNPRWQRFFYDYLTGARSYVLVRGRSEVGDAYFRALSLHPRLATVDGFVLHAGG